MNSSRLSTSTSSRAATSRTQFSPVNGRRQSARTRVNSSLRSLAANLRAPFSRIEAADSELLPSLLTSAVLDRLHPMVTRYHY